MSSLYLRALTVHFDAILVVREIAMISVHIGK